VQELRHRVAVVTGAASGIGLAIAEAFVREGMRVSMADLDEDTLHAQAERLRAAGGEVLPLGLDVRDPDAVDRVGRVVSDHFGALHVAVNNAGVVNGGRSWDLSLEDWRRVIDVDLWGVIHGVRTFIPLILDAGEEGHVVNVASMASVLTLERLAPYTVAKHVALGAPVGASVVMPGMVRTAMNPIGTLEPSVVAANVLDAIRRNRAYVFTDQQSATEVEQRLAAIVAARSEVVQ